MYYISARAVAMANKFTDSRIEWSEIDEPAKKELESNSLKSPLEFIKELHSSDNGKILLGLPVQEIRLYRNIHDSLMAELIDEDEIKANVTSCTLESICSH